MNAPDTGLIRDQVGELAHQRLACQESQLLTASWAHNSLGVHQIPKTRTLTKETPHVPLAQSTYDVAQYAQSLLSECSELMARLMSDNLRFKDHGDPK
ncbi:hypothetical protein N7490_005040 [Penicillium lividum]|nr:hypothetical protein N7490_005040 [Penicillium lividum]